MPCSGSPRRTHLQATPSKRGGAPLHGNVHIHSCVSQHALNHRGGEEVLQPHHFGWHVRPCVTRLSGSKILHYSCQTVCRLYSVTDQHCMYYTPSHTKKGLVAWRKLLLWTSLCTYSSGQLFHNDPATATSQNGHVAFPSRILSSSTHCPSMTMACRDMDGITTKKT